jgi:hypothetical protein
MCVWKHDKQVGWWEKLLVWEVPLLEVLLPTIICTAPGMAGYNREMIIRLSYSEKKGKLYPIRSQPHDLRQPSWRATTFHARQ